MTKNKVVTTLASALVGVAVVAHAQTAPVRPAYSYPTQPVGEGPAAVQVGDSPVYMTPYVGGGIGHDDNLFLSHTNEKSSDFYVLSPGFRLDARSPNSVIQFAYQAQLGRYTSSRDDDYQDQTAHLQVDTAFSGRSFLRVGTDYIRGHDPRGSTDRPISGSPDKYRLIAPNATYALGAPGAQGRIELYWSDAYKTYLNNRDHTTQSDRDDRILGGIGYWRIGPKTYLLAETRYTDIDYRLPTSPFSSREFRYFGGVTWEATAATTGTLKIGRVEKKFDNDTFPRFTGTSYEGTVTWLPRTYSRFDFYAVRTPNESTGIGDFILSDIGGVNWNHDWSSVLMTGVALKFQRDAYQGFDRTDRTAGVGVRVGYKFRRWLTLGAEYSWTKRDSNLDQFQYEKNFYLLSATASM